MFQRTFMHIKDFKALLSSEDSQRKRATGERGVCISFDLLMVRGVRPRLQAEQEGWSEIVVIERLQVRLWWTVAVFRLKGDMKESFGEAHALGYLKTEWRQRGIIKVER